MKVASHLGVQRVGDLRPVQPDHQDARTLFLKRQGFIRRRSHGSPSVGMGSELWQTAVQALTPGWAVTSFMDVEASARASGSTIVFLPMSWRPTMNSGAALTASTQTMMLFFR